MTRPSLAPELLAAITERAPKRVIRKLDQEPTLAEGWAWSTDGERTRIETGTETVELTAVAGRVTALAQVRCSCLLAPACLHVMAVLSVLDTAEADVPESDVAAPNGAEAAPPKADTPKADGAASDFATRTVATRTVAAPNAESARGPEVAATLTEAQLDAADLTWRRGAEFITVGASAAGTVLQAELLRAVHSCRSAGLHRLAAAGQRVVQGIRSLRAERPEFELAALSEDVGELLSTAYQLRQRRAAPALIGSARRNYEAVGNLRLFGLCTEAVVTASGYAGVVTHLVDAEGRSWTLPDLKPGQVERVREAYGTGVELGDVSLPHRRLGREGLFVSGATGSSDGRLGAGKGVKAVRATPSMWDQEPLAARFAEPLDVQLRAALSREPGGAGLLTFSCEIVGTDGEALIVEASKGCVLRCLPAYEHQELPALENIALLARAPGLPMRAVARPISSRAGVVVLLAVGPAEKDGDCPRLELPEEWRNRCNLALDRLQRSHLTRARSEPEFARSAITSPPDPLAALHRRLDRVVLGGAQTLSPGTADELAREAALLDRRLMPTASAALRHLARTAQWTRQTLFGTRSAVDPERFAAAWLAAWQYRIVAQRRLELEAWALLVERYSDS